MKNNSYTVAVLGAGNIGSAVISRLLHLDNEVININLAKVLVSDSTKDRDFDSSLITEDFNDIATDSFEKHGKSTVSYKHLTLQTILLV